MGKEPLTEERLFEIKARAKAATPGPWVKNSRSFGCVDGYGSEWHPTVESQKDKDICYLYDNDNAEDDAAHIAASSPDVVRADLEEILALRAEVARLKDEIASLEQELKFSDETEYELIKKLFDLKICHKEVICEQADAHKLNFDGESGCLFCWRQWAIRKARKAEIEEE